MATHMLTKFFLRMRITCFYYNYVKYIIGCRISILYETLCKTNC